MLLAKGVPSEKLVLPISPLIAQKTLKDPSAPELGASAQLQMLMVTPLILGFYQVTFLITCVVYENNFWLWCYIKFINCSFARKLKNKVLLIGLL